MTDATPVAPALRGRRELIAWRNAVFVIFALSGMSIASWVARIPAIRDELGATTGAIGLLILGLSVGSVVGLIASAPLLARLGARNGMVLALLLVGLGLALVGVGSAIPGAPVLLAIGLVVLGFGNGSLDVMMNVEGAAAEKELGKTVMPLMHAFFSFGTVVGAGLGALASLLDVAVVWHLLVMALLIAATALVAVRSVPHRDELDDPDTAPGQARPSWVERLREDLAVWADLRLILIGVVMLGMAFAEGSANDWLALAVVDGHLETNTMGAVVFGVFVAAMTLGRVLGGPVLDRFGRVPVLRVSAALAIAGLLLFIFVDVDWIYIAGVILWGIGCSLGFPVGMSAAADDPKKAAARVSAVAMIGYCAFLVGPPIIGFLGQTFGILSALLLVLVLVVLSGLAAPATRERARETP
ncbi:MFS transporter [Compostimonas suwonensis]|uniref:Fucose permease n=1 Tax=Compostimonas suwonensis TaxID=1048394 RepID=A0A2M9C445_9MICO|nr:MFS transporter [Compostimonas suwonensis]PJJ65259.1 fucose permease [Compostimonas suwonensis]